ncbi:MAG: Asp-tRNA(Asn)/Glu-tRNA(Gln) amidotransferase subunit GatC [Patescibacteria group bacterium]
MKVDVLHIAKLANLTLTKEEADKYEQQLSSILAYIDKLQTLDTKDTKETSQVTGLENITAEDNTEPSLSQEEALSNAKITHNGLFKVKGVLTNEE